MTVATQSKLAIPVADLNTLWKTIGHDRATAIASGAPFELKVFPKPGDPLRLPKIFSPRDLFPDSALTIWRGDPKGKGLEGPEAIYESADLAELSTEQMVFDHFLRVSDGDRIVGEEKMLRALEAMKSGIMLLGGRTAVALWQDYQRNKEKSHLEWLRASRGITWFDLPGVVLRNSYGYRYVTYFYFSVKVWNVRYRWLFIHWYRNNPSGLLASTENKPLGS